MLQGKATKKGAHNKADALLLDDGKGSELSGGVYVACGLFCSFRVG